MADPALVADSVRAMRRTRTDLPVTVKCRIGIDDQDGEADLDRFADAMVKSRGGGALTCMPGKAWLQGLSLKENTATSRRCITSACIASLRGSGRCPSCSMAA